MIHLHLSKYILFQYKALIVNTKAIIISHLRYGDNSLIVHLYTECSGRQTIFIKGAYSKKSPMRAVLFQPLYIVETEIHHRENRQMQNISNIQIVQPLHNIPFDPVKSSIALFIAEVLYKTLKEEEANRQLFDFLVHSIQTLDLNDRGTANFHLLFLIHYTRYLGFYPSMEHILDGMWFDMHKGNCAAIQKGSPTYPEYNLLLGKLFGLSFEHLDDMKITHHQRNFLTERLLTYYAMHVDHFGKMKSFPVLRNVFQD